MDGTVNSRSGSRPHSITLSLVSLSGVLGCSILFHCVKGDRGFDYGESLNTGERDVFGLESVVVADEADAVWGVRLLDILDHGEEITAGYEREQIDLPPEDAIER